MQTFTPILTSQDGCSTFKMSDISGITMSGSMTLYVILVSVGEYWIGKFNSEKRAKEVMKAIWYAIDADSSYTVPQED